MVVTRLLETPVERILLMVILPLLSLIFLLIMIIFTARAVVPLLAPGTEQFNQLIRVSSVLCFLRSGHCVVALDRIGHGYLKR